MGVAEAHYAKSPETGSIGEFPPLAPWRRLRARHFVRAAQAGWLGAAQPAAALHAVRERCAHPLGKRSSFTRSRWRRGLPALPTMCRSPKGPDNRALAARYPLQCIVPPNRFFLNSSFSQSELLRRAQKAPTVMLAAPERHGARHPGRGRGPRGERARRRPLTAQVDGCHAAPAWSGRGDLVAPLPFRRPRRYVADQRPLTDMGEGPAFHSNSSGLACLTPPRRTTSRRSSAPALVRGVSTGARVALPGRRERSFSTRRLRPARGARSRLAPWSTTADRFRPRYGSLARALRAGQPHEHAVGSPMTSRSPRPAFPWRASSSRLRAISVGGAP